MGLLRWKLVSVIKDLVVIGAGDFGREVIWLTERINQIQPAWNILGFVDDADVGTEVGGYQVLGDIDWLIAYEKPICAVCAVANGKSREQICNRLITNLQIEMATLIDPAAICGKNSNIGEGSIVCAGSILTVDVQLGKNCIINLNSTIGHDTILESYCTLHPGANVSGKVVVGARSLLGTGTRVIQGLSIAADVVLGAGTVVIRDIKESGTYVGVPERKIK